MSWDLESDASISQPGPALDGSGGSDMLALVGSREDGLGLFGPIGENLSSYDLPSGVGGAGWELQPPETETFSETTAVEPALDGSGGSDMLALVGSREDGLGLLGPIGENLSSYALPGGVGGDGWDLGPPETEMFTGISAEGTVLDANGQGLSGTASLIVGDPEQTEEIADGIGVSGVIASEDTAGSFLLSGAPPAGVWSGESGDQALQTIAVTFTPHTAGIPLTEEFDTFHSDIGIHQYGQAKGMIIDADGDPVPGVGVQAAGMGTNTGDDGMFSLTGPIGERIPIVTLDGTLEASITMHEDPDDHIQEFQYPALTVEVVDAEFAPVESAPVEIDNQTTLTDEDGEVSVSPIPLGEYTLTVMEQYTATVEVDEQGVDYVFTFGPDEQVVDWEPDPSGIGGLKITAVDNKSGALVRGVSARLPEQGIVSESNEEGVVKLLTTEVDDEDGPVSIQIGTEDMRYNPTQVDVEEMPQGEMIEATVYLSRQNQVVNF